MKEIKVQEFVRRIRHRCADHDARFGFFLGAGCSRTSGIPAAGELVRRWLPKLEEIKDLRPEQRPEWLPDYSDESAAKYYAEVMHERFPTAEERQMEIERIVSNKNPGFGYAVLARLMTHPEHGSNFNTVFTTNFDDMVADALYLYARQKPLVIAHESLAGFAKINRKRPLVFKIHGDARLAPKNTLDEIEALQEEVEKKLLGFLDETCLIVVGYGGNDSSIAKLFSALQKGSPPGGIFWVGERIPDTKLGKQLNEMDNVFLVPHLDFDELMLLFHEEFDLTPPDKAHFEKILDGYFERFKELRERLETREGDEAGTALTEAARKVTADFKSWWAVQLEADKYEKADPERADEIYAQGIKEFPDSHQLCGNYALFLKNIRKDYDKAQAYYKHALDADPENATKLGNYATFLADIRKDDDEAQAYYRRALDADPENANHLGNYAVFLTDIRKDYDEAQAYYRRALDADPEHANNLGNYANFLAYIRKDYDEAQAYYRRALDADPGLANHLGNYAVFLKNFRKDYDEAQAYYRRALDADPEHAHNLGNYALFLADIRKDYDEAQAYYRRALDADPESANKLGNYAKLLLEQGRVEDARSKLESALRYGSDHASLLLECRFYQYAHGVVDENGKDPLLELKRLLTQEVRSPGWDLSGNIERAEQDGHSQVDLLKALGKVIADEAEIEILDAFEVWREIDVGGGE